MKKILKIVLTVAFVAGSTSVFAQKLGRINMQELVFAMPETAEMQKNLEAYQKELQDQLETIGVEFNNKLNEYTKQVSDKNSTMSDSVRQLKEKELNDLKTRYDEFVQVSQQDMQKKQGELLEPIIVKAQDAVKEVSKAGRYTVVYDTSVNAVAYFDEAVVTDILPAVKTKLGIKDTPAAAPAAPAAK
ncbi:OmpH family outer membrane protein [Alistipes communis]|uniref:OmpH family outer membrane protein n=1 Tax=Alistipes communis TaxID=2585118 RepID=UPI0039F59258